MPIVTISRGSYSGGKMLAKGVAQKLGYRCINRDQITPESYSVGRIARRFADCHRKAANLSRAVCPYEIHVPRLHSGGTQ